MKQYKFGLVMLLGILFYLVEASECATATVPKPTWQRKIAIAICKYMWENGEKQVWFHYPNGQMYKFTVTPDFMEKIVYADYDAAVLNPSWGPRRLVTLKELCYQYTESRYDQYCTNINITVDANGSTHGYGTVDCGFCQINQCNWVGPYYNFCLFEGLCKKGGPLPSFRYFWSYYYNASFAAWINESRIKHHQSVYKYYTNKSNQDLYDTLIKVMGFQKVALKYNDGQYFDRSKGYLLPATDNMPTNHDIVEAPNNNSTATTVVPQAR